MWFLMCIPVHESWSPKDYRDSQKHFQLQTVKTLASGVNSHCDLQQTERQPDTAEQQP